jgi:hypothetical protein
VLVGVVSGVTGQSRALTFDGPTLAQYSELLLSEQCWPQLVGLYDGMQPTTLRRLLEGVQKSRNALAHFRGELTPLERSHLRVCAE